ncbi:serine/threonine protein kinase [Frankia sp. B2]|uniref:serine/threonine-protein kinase n=1 Tax=unclassified Frankia TaxID=2632575 RepID=UPI00046169F4|nr:MULTISPECIES: serine/threonine-protein kinase [unclassified Frankia]KDA41762.1 serine/threonine protein kinase [Frankia sp. BMG5.23]TFE29610.1 serine/threonine protein kinase [Frankia sp. B2]
MTVDGVGIGPLVAGRYRLVERIGSGGMGTVWRAHDDVLRVEVAIKEIRVSADLDDDERAAGVETAMREARNAARLRGNPHVVTVHDAVEHDGLPWIVMELVRAGTLATTVNRDGPLPPERAIQVGLAVLDALVAGQRMGVLHRDVKPSNILLADDGRVLLTDFGIATHAADPTLTGGIGSGGTPAYMAPERLLGGPATLAGDLFALGATLYFAVEGVSPFQRDTLPTTIGAVLHADPPPFLRGGRLSAAIAGLLAKNPASRLRAEGAQALLTWAASHPADSAPASLVSPASPASPAASLPPSSASPAASLPPSPAPDAVIRRRTGSRPVPFPPAWPGTARPPGAVGWVRSWRAPRLMAGAMILLVLLAAVAAGAYQLFGADDGGDGDRRRASPPTVATRDPAGVGSQPGAEAGEALPPGMIGSWSGSVTQAFVHFNAELVLRGGRIGEVIGTSAYPESGCAGELVLRGVSGASVRLEERLTRVGALCFAATWLDLVLHGDGTLDCSYPATEISSAGQATMRRSAPPMSPSSPAPPG